jgi:large subunit ribosomal protein L18e
MIRCLGKDQARTAVVVGVVTDDQRTLDMPKLNVAALRFTETARARIIAAGGSCMTLDQLVMQTPSGTNTLLLRGPKEREARRHFGALGIKGKGHAKPYTRGRYTEIKGGLR